MIDNPILLGSPTPAGGLILPITGSGGLAGYEFTGTDGPAVTVQTGPSPDGPWSPLAAPATLAAGTYLLLTRTDTSPVVSVLRTRAPDVAAPVGEVLTVHPDGHVTDTFGRAVLGDPYTVQVGGFVSPAAPEIQGGAVRFHLPAGTAAAPDDGSLADVGEHARIRLPAATWNSGTGPVRIGFDLTHVSSAATAGDPPMTQFRVFLLGGALEWCWAISTDGGGELWFGTTEPDGQLFLNDWNVYSFDAPEDPTGAWVLTLDTAGGRVRASHGGVEVMNEPLPAEFLSGGGGQVALGVWRSRLPVGSGTDWPEQTVTLDNLTITAG